MTNVHIYDNYNTAYNFLFHPLHRSKENKTKALLAIITNIFLSIITAGTWQIVFWTINRLDHRKITAVKASEDVKPKKPLSELLENYVVCPKLLETPKPIEFPEFTPLTQEKLRELLDELPTLTALLGLGNFPVDEVIYRVHGADMPNDPLRKKLQFIVHTISIEPERSKREDMLRDLSGDFIDCHEVSRGMLDNRFRKLAMQQEFVPQMQEYLSYLKDKAVEQAILQLVPAINTDDYAETNAHRTEYQFPHIKHSFIKEYGEEIGLSVDIAKKDKYATSTLPQLTRDKFLKTYESYFNMEEVLKHFIMQVNANGKKGSSISPTFLMKWAGDNSIKHDVFFNKDYTYPDYCAKPDKEQEGYTKPYITEQTAIDIFVELGYLTKKE